MKNCILTIDPGLTGTGVAAWFAKSWDETKKEIPSFMTMMFSTKEKEWQIAAQDIAIKMKERCKYLEITDLYIEYPRAFQSSLGMAALQRGDIFKLVFLIGVIRATFPEAQFYPVKVADWKGQLPKEEIERRCRRILPEGYTVESHHIWDAVGIGLYLQGRI